MGIAALLFAGGAVVAATAVHVHQTALSHKSSYDTTWIASQASVEFGRLYERVSALAVDTDAAGVDQVRLRFDLFTARYNDFDSLRFRDFLSTDPAASAAAARLSDAVRRVARLVDDIGRPSDLDALRREMRAMPGELATVAGAAHRFGIDQAAGDQGELSALYRAFMALTACMTVCCVALMTVLLRQVRCLSEARRELAHLAHHDHLTGLPNRMAFSRRLETALGDAGVRCSVAVHTLDLDRFKAVNDELGHAAGDELLRQVAGRLVAVLPQGAFAARVGGDEFAIVQPVLGGRQEAGLLASAIVRALSRPFAIEGQELTVGASVGVAIAPVDGATAALLLRRADLALYRVKRAGAGAWAYSGDLAVENRSDAA